MTSAAEPLDARTKELVGISAAAAANCLPCLRYHTTAAQQAGCTGSEIIAAMEMGLLVKARPDADMERLVRQLSTRLDEAAGAHQEHDSEGENQNADV